jgi:hypothetical protein
LDELAVDQSADHIEKTGEEKEEDAVETQSIDWSRRKNAGVG